MRYHEIINELEFFGSKCTKDCSGHKAGFAWAAKKGTTNHSPCANASQSFTNGCTINTRIRHNAQKERERQAQQDQKKSWAAKLSQRIGSFIKGQGNTN